MDEYRAACALCAFDDVVVVGKIGEVFPDRVDHWVSFHVDLFDRWAAARQQAGLPPASNFWGAYFKGRRLGIVRRKDGREICATQQRPLHHAPSIGGSSGFLAVQVALNKLECDRVVLAGIPMEPEGHHYAGCITPQEARMGFWEEADKYWKTWVEHAGELRGRVRSMSGRTRAEFGAPTRKWLCP